MPQIMLDAPRPLPGWLRVVGSVVIAMHLVVFVNWALAQTSGPWPTDFGPSPAESPYFARPIATASFRAYLQPLRMTHNYHFETNQVALAGVYFEVHLRNEKGQMIKTLRFPDENANPWTRHRHLLLARGLLQDMPLPPPEGEQIAAPKRQLETVTIWEPGANQMTLAKVPQHRVPRDRPVSSPSEWSLLLAQAYMRHLCREHGAASAELIRHSRQVVWPWYVLPDAQIPPGALDMLNCNFGEYRRGE